jgi:cell wall-associated NlpC family hydrolase
MDRKKYKWLIIGLLIVVLFSSTITIALASSEPNGYVINEATLYSGPSYNASGYTTLSAGTEICVYGQYHQWYEVGWNGKTGYVLSEYVSVDHKQDYTITIDATPVPIAPVATPFNKPMEPAPSEPTTTTLTPTPTSTFTPSGDTSIVESAEAYLGVPYKWGGTTDKGMDCSGFVQKAYEDAGYSIGRTTQIQAFEGKEVEDYAPGDILCFGRSKWNIFHTGIYIGDGKFIHSSSPEGVVVSELDGYGLKLIMARRISEE